MNLFEYLNANPMAILIIALAVGYIVCYVIEAMSIAHGNRCKTKIAIAQREEESDRDDIKKLAGDIICFMTNGGLGCIESTHISKESFDRDLSILLERARKLGI